MVGAIEIQELAVSNVLCPEPRERERERERERINAVLFLQKKSWQLKVTYVA